MTNEEKLLIRACRILVIDSGQFITCIRAGLERLGFGNVLHVADECVDTGDVSIIIEYMGPGQTPSAPQVDIPVIYPFDFVEGAGAIVMFGDDDRVVTDRSDIRVWAAEYMAGYCAFWNVPGADWLRSALPAVRAGVTSAAAMRTAADMCARIAANIAVGRDVKRYPRFYLSKNI